MICENCGNEHSGSYGSGRFCSMKCSRGFVTKYKRKEINKKISNSLKGSGHGDVIKICKFCKKEFNICYNKRHQIFCSRSCGTSYLNKTINLASKAGRSSSQGKRSKNEILFSDFCKSIFSNVLENKNIFNGWDADIILINEKIAILWNGKWHYEKITESHSLKQVKNRDIIKLDEIKKCGYIPYVIKDMGSYDPNFVNQEFEKFIKYIAVMKAGDEASIVS